MFGKKKTKATEKKKASGKRLLHAPKGFSTETPAAKEEFLYISNEAHYDQVIERIKTVKKILWIGTADIKDLYVKDGRGTKPLLEVLSDLAKHGVEIRLIHAKEPGPLYANIVVA